MGPGRGGAASSRSFDPEQFRLPLQALEWDHGEAYEFTVTADGWSAVRRDGNGTLRANSPDALKKAITADQGVRR